jgi:pilus assembly protein CpaF
MIPEAVFHATLLDLLAPVRPLLDDPTVSELMINGPDEVWVERSGKLGRSEARFPSDHALLAVVRGVAQYVGRTIGAEQPILEARLPDGSRVEALVPPASRGRVIVSIRRFPEVRLTLSALRAQEALTAEVARVLELAVVLKRNVLVAGGTGSGKTSLLNALSALIPPDERIVVIEDASELRVQQPHVLYLEARPPDARDRGEITVRQLLRASLRLRPDRIVVGEVRGGEALDLVQAMTSGHGGCLSTVHAAHPLDALHRLETTALMSDVELPLEALREQIGSAIDLVVQTSRLNDGSRRVTHLTECSGYARGEGYRLTELFVFRHAGRDPATDRVLGRLQPTGLPSALGAQLRARGHELPPGLAPPVEEPHA